MKYWRYCIPLTAVTACITAAALFIPIPGNTLTGPALLFAGFIVTSLFGLHETIQNEEPVVKTGQRTPWLMPVVMFTCITGAALITTEFAAPGDTLYLWAFAGVLVPLYFLAVYPVIIVQRRSLRKKTEFEKNRRWIPGKKRLLLINPVNPERGGLTLNPSSKFPPLGLGIIASLTPEDYDIILIDENIRPFRFTEADIVGITAFTASAPRAYEIAGYYRDRNIPVVMGGIHASMNTEEALEHVDSVVKGECEALWPRVIRDFKNNGIERIYASDYPPMDLNILPRRDIFSSEYLFSTVQTSRGCPMDCSFCSVTAFNGRRYRHRPVDDVLEELETIPGRYLFFVDDNIAGHSRSSMERAAALFRGMTERKINKMFFCQASMNFGNNDDLLRHAARAGCRMVFLGIESADPEELRAMNKGLNARLEYEKVFRNIRRHGIAVLGAFIVGTDTETADTIRRKTGYIKDAGVDVIQTTRLTPLPGTRFYRELEENDRLLYTEFPGDWARYDMTEMLFKPALLSLEEMNRLDREMNLSLYSRYSLFKKFMSTLGATKSFETALWAYNSNINYRNVFLAADSHPGRLM